MIYTHWGEEVRVIADHGKHQVEGLKYPVQLVTVEEKKDGRRLAQMAFTLKADGGYEEVEKEVELADRIDLDAEALKKALKEAE